MVAHLLRLKLLLLRNLFRRSRAQTIGIIAGIIYFSFAVIGVALLLGALRASLDDARVLIPLVGAATIVLWTIVPLFTFGSDPTLDPARFSTFAVPTRDLAVGLALAALIGLPAIATGVIMVGVFVASTMTLASAVVGCPLRRDRGADGGDDEPLGLGARHRRPAVAAWPRRARDPSPAPARHRGSARGLPRTLERRREGHAGPPLRCRRLDAPRVRLGRAHRHRRG